MTSFRSGFVAIVGRPSVGKSTLVNGLLGAKLSIVTPKPQTTRDKILGILNGEDHQLILIDTPGLLRPEYMLHKRMEVAARSAARDEADMICLMVEPRVPSEDDLKLYERLDGLGKPLDLVINKLDALKRAHDADAVAAAYAAKLKLRKTWKISALTMNGVEHLKRGLIEALPEHPPFYPTDQSTDRYERYFATELVREKVLELYGEEIPYSTAVELEDFVEHPGEKDMIRINLLVERPSQKGILLGKGGQSLKKLGEKSRLAIERMTGRPARLELWVKVAPNWRNDPEVLKRLGY